MLVVAGVPIVLDMVQGRIMHVFRRRNSTNIGQRVDNSRILDKYEYISRH